MSGFFDFRLEHLQEIAQHIAGVADDRHVDADVLVDRGGIDVDVDLLRARRERVDPAGDAVVEARTDAQHDVAAVHRHVGLVGAVHAEHAEPVLAGRRIGAEPHQGRSDRKTRRLDQFAQQFRGFGSGIDDAAAGVDHRTFRGGEQRHRFADLRGVALDPRRVGDVHVRLARRVIAPHRELHVLRHVDHHRPGPAGARDIERLVQHFCEIIDVAHQPVVLGAGPGDADGVAFLERIVADQMRGNLSGDADQRNRIHQRVRQRRHHVGGAGA